VYSHRYVSHLLKNHLNELFVGANISEQQSKIAKKNYNNLKQTTKNTDIPYMFQINPDTRKDDGTFCCFKCSTVVKRHSLFETKHFSNDKHIKENITCVIKLLERIDKMKLTPPVEKPIVITKQTLPNTDDLEEILFTANTTVREHLINKKITKNLYNNIIDLQTKLQQSEQKRSKMLELIRSNHLWSIDMENEWNNNTISKDDVKRELDTKIDDLKDELKNTSTEPFWDGLESEMKSIGMLKYATENFN
jgi:hypothetical protein